MTRIFSITPSLIAFASVVLVSAATDRSSSAQQQFAFAQGGLLVGSVMRSIIVRDVIGSPAADVIALSDAANSIRMVDLAGGVTALVLATPFLPQSVIADDLDGDGDNDIAAAAGPQFGNGAGSVLVWLNNAGFGSPTSVAVPFAGRLTARDMDQDGDPDLVVGKTILWNDGAGAFPTLFTIPSTTPMTHWTPGDFDGDGDVDLITTFRSGYTWGFETHMGRIFRRNSNGSWTLLSGFPIETTLTAVTFGDYDVADMNQDGIDDLIVNSGYHYAENLPQAAHVHVMTGAPGFVFTDRPGLRLSGSVLKWGLSRQDFDGDGDDDIVGLVQHPTYVPIILLNDGQGGLSPAGGRLFAAFVPTIGGSIGAGDIDFDNDVDIVAMASFAPSGSGPGNWLRQFMNQPTLAPSTPFLIPIVPTTVGANVWGDVQAVVWFPDYLDGFGQAVRADLSAYPGAFNPYGDTYLTDAYGEVKIGFVGGSPITAAPIVLSLPAGQSQTVYVDALPSIEKDQGDNQSANVGASFAQTLGVHLNAVGGAPSGGAEVAWVSSSPNLSLAASTSTTDPVSGNAYMSINASMSTGTYTVTATRVAYFGPAVPSVAFTVTVSNFGEMTVVAGQNQNVNVAEPITTPLKVELVDPMGLPLSGLPVTFSVIQGAAVLPSPLAITNSDGIASCSAVPTMPGTLIIRATTEVFGHVDFNLFVRGLYVYNTSSGVVAVYFHEHVGVPIALMVDFPQPSPGYLTTPAGNLFTSLLLPAPTVIILDGIGIFGAINSSLVTNNQGNWVRQFVIATPPGLAWVAQIVSFDSSYAWPQSLDLSNAVNFVF